jgi:Fic family protein
LRTLIKERQEQYYESLGKSDNTGESTAFIEFMLEIILESLEELLNIQNVSLTNIDRINLFKSIVKNDYFTRKEYLKNFREISSATASRDLNFAVENGVVEMMLDATQNYQKPLTNKRLFGWHSALFPTGHSGMHKIEVGHYRTGEMQIVSGAMGKEKVHYEAVPATRVKEEMDKFLKWFNDNTPVTHGSKVSKGVRDCPAIDPVLKSAIAHFWFIIIHPFDDGNGRMARAISDLMLARADKTNERYYSMSNQILVERKQYYAILQKVQHSNGDITEWLDWFLHCLKNSLIATEATLQKILRKNEFWIIHENTAFNERQRLVLNRLFDGFDGKLKSSKWAKIAKCSTDTALRDIKDLIDKGILRQDKQGGRSTNYELT